MEASSAFLFRQASSFVRANLARESLSSYSQVNPQVETEVFKILSTIGRCISAIYFDIHLYVSRLAKRSGLATKGTALQIRGEEHQDKILGSMDTTHMMFHIECCLMSSCDSRSLLRAIYFHGIP